jgi:Ricin-type beta-trefoil lectin domain
MRSLAIRVTAVFAALWCILALVVTGTASAAQQYQGHLVNSPGPCLNVVGYGVQPGNRTEIWNCNNEPAENWVLRENGQMYNPNSGLCLNTVGYSGRLGTPTELWACNSQVALWTYTTVWPSNAPVLKHTQSGLCLNVKAQATGPGARTEIWYCHPDMTSMRWQWAS